jgi:hypothetical protein
MKHAPVFSAALLFAVVWLFAPPSTFSQEVPSQEAPSQDATPAPGPAGSQPKPAGREYQPLGDVVSGGSGLFTGSNTDTVQGSVDRQLSRLWHGNTSFGYAINSSLASGNSASVPPTFDSWFAGAGLDRPLGRTANLSIAYSAYIQDISQTGCSVAACSSDLQHQVSLSFQWHTRPLVLG